MGLSTLAIIFAGVTGGHHDRLDAQLAGIAQDMHLAPHHLAPAALHSLAHHDTTTRTLVQNLHVDGVVAFEVTDKGALRVVVYDADGTLTGYSDSPLTDGALAEADLVALRDELATDLPPIDPAVAPDPAPDSTAASPAPAAADAPVAAADAGSVSASEIEAMMAGSAPTATTATGATTVASVESSASVAGPELHIGASVGVGIATRSFTPAPSTVAAYGSSPVGAAQLAIEIEPTSWTRLRISTERTLGMTTALEAGNASTTMSRSEATGTVAVQRGAVDLLPAVGIGQRSFSIESMDSGRSPDNEYDYLMLGMGARVRLADRVALDGGAAFEPVVAGSEPTEMALGEATRWAVDASAAASVKLGMARVRASVDYQRFTWAWNQAGARGAGGATDSYLTASLSIGAEY